MRQCGAESVIGVMCLAIVHSWCYKGRLVLAFLFSSFSVLYFRVNLASWEVACNSASQHNGHSHDMSDFQPPCGTIPLAYARLVPPPHNSIGFLEFYWSWAPARPPEDWECRGEEDPSKPFRSTSSYECVTLWLLLTMFCSVRPAVPPRITFFSRSAE